MEYVIFLNGKPIEEATQEERNALNETARKAFTKYLGIKYDTKHPRSERVSTEG